MTTSSMFHETLSLLIREEGSSWLINEVQGDRFSYVQHWLTPLCFSHEASMYGLQAMENDISARFTTAMLLDVLHDDFRNPFVTIVGADEHSTHVLEQLHMLLPYWRTPDVWQYVQQDGTFSFPDQINGGFLERALYDELQQHDLSISELPALIPVFKEGNWPLQTSITTREATIAFRLREPDDNDAEWLLETVVNGKRNGSYWTPAVKKRTLPIERALPAKWAEQAAAIEAQQQKAFSLLSLLESESPKQFLYKPLTDEQLRQFLQHDVVKLQAFGYFVVLPAWLKDLNKPKLRTSVTAGTTKSNASLHDVLEFNWQFSINNETISAEQFRRLVGEKREFIRIGTEWFQLDEQWLEKMKALMDKTENKKWTVRDLLFRELQEELEQVVDDVAEQDDPILQLNMQQSLKRYLQQLEQKEGLPAVAVPPTLNAQLRFYQHQGFEWLTFMRKQQFGACLADDMGLGKTIQLITYVLQLFEEQRNANAVLIICPTSVLGNWQREIARFAPMLQVYTHYGSNREKEQFVDTITQERPHIVLSTYGTVTQDADMLREYTFSCITLDEAQNIKNMQTQQSRAIRRLHGEHHIALTGTPVENRLAELWAIFDFIHRGYFGSFKTFSDAYIAPIERDDDEAKKEELRLKISPFLLRRTKRDPKLMLNLPDKQEQHEYCPLSTEQAVLYESYVQNALADLEELSPFERRGRILKTLTKLKQLCNHPALYLKEDLQDAKSLLQRSEKVKRIVSLSAQIVENREQCLIFTQYIGMGELLQLCLKELHGIDVPFLTGATPKAQRDTLVEQFQAGAFPIFILSLKAGGTGLNLTAASHVLHADRWWNPAVENQATDRAYRIGQTRFVHVHKFMTTGTIEEKIDKMLTTKQALSEDLIQSSNWITELAHEELQQLLTYN